LLGHPNVWHRRTAQRLLSERRDEAVSSALRERFHGRGGGGDADVLDGRLAALWTLHTSGALTYPVLNAAASDPEPAIRAWAARLVGERQVGGEADLEILRELASDPDPAVRLAVAVACRQFVSSQLTVNRRPLRSDVVIDELLTLLIARSAAGEDAVIPFMIWLAAEPVVAADPEGSLEWLAENGADHLPLAAELTHKAMRRLADLDRNDSVHLAMEFVNRVVGSSDALAAAALEGLIEAQEGRALKPAGGAGAFIAKLTAHPNDTVAGLGEKLGAIWGDPAALKVVISRATDPELDENKRVRAIQTARWSKGESVRGALLGLVARGVPERIQREAIAALGEIGGENVADELLARWDKMSPVSRGAAAAALASRTPWAMPLIAEIRAGRISASDFSAPVIRSLVRHRNDAVREAARAAIGRFRETPEEKEQLFAEKRRAVLAGTPDLEAGREVARKTCLVCHKFLGEGAEVGPDLTGVGRSSLDALLWNIIDPNQVIGAGYEQVEVETKDDRIVAGRLVENTDQRVRLLLQGPAEEVIAREDVLSQRTLQSSVMPEGLEQMADAEFRDLVWFILAPPEEGPLTPEKRRALGVAF
jgi:putative heme-binding domain-containing protein